MNLAQLQEKIHSDNVNAGWWDNIDKESIVERLAKLMLVVTEVAEAAEGFRKELNDDHLPHRLMAEVELADALIRICDLSGACGFDLMGAVTEKLEYNRNRLDHKRENRALAGGKKY